LPGEDGLVFFQDQVDALADELGDGDLRAVVEGLELLVLLRGDVDRRCNLLAQRKPSSVHSQLLESTTRADAFSLALNFSKNFWASSRDGNPPIRTRYQVPLSGIEPTAMKAE